MFREGAVAAATSVKVRVSVRLLATTLHWLPQAAPTERQSIRKPGALMEVARRHAVEGALALQTPARLSPTSAAAPRTFENRQVPHHLLPYTTHHRIQQPCCTS